MFGILKPREKCPTCDELSKECSRLITDLEALKFENRGYKKQVEILKNEIEYLRRKNGNTKK